MEGGAVVSGSACGLKSLPWLVHIFFSPATIPCNPRIAGRESLIGAKTATLLRPRPKKILTEPCSNIGEQRCNSQTIMIRNAKNH